MVIAKAMGEKAAQVRYWCSPRSTELKPGQVVWLAYSTILRKSGVKRLLVPVALTLFSFDKQGLIFINRGDCNDLRIVQIGSNTAEA